MNFQRLRWGEWIAGIAGLDLALVTFRSWYKISETGAKVTAWDALTTGRYLLIATAVVGVFLLLIQASEQTAELSFPPGAIAAVVGLGCTVYVAYRLASPPADNLDPDVGIYFGLAGAMGVALGGLLSMREGTVTAYAGPVAATEPTEPAWGAGATTPPEFGGPEPAAGWSPAAPAPAGETWTPAAPPPATAAGQAAAAGGVQAGDEVRLTAGGTKFPAGTIARIVQVFGGGALVEVTAPDGVPERFEVPDAAYEPAGAGPATGVAEPPAAAPTPATGGESWSPAMPAPAEAGRPPEDWGFGEPSDGAAAPGGPEAAAEPGEGAPAEKKVPWWKREIGGKKKDEDGGAAETAALAAGTAAAGAAAVEAGDEEEERPGFFKRLFGGGKPAAEEQPKADEWTVPPEGGAGAEAERAESREQEAEAVPEPEAAAAAAEPEPEPPAPEPEPEAAAPEPEPEPPAPEPEPPAPEPEPEPPAPEPEPEAAAPEPEPEPQPPAPEPEPEAAAPEPEPEPPAPEPEPPAPEPEPPAPAPEPEAAAPEPEPEPPAPEPEAAAPEAAAAAEAADEKPAEKPPAKRRRSSGSRKAPKKALDAAAAEGGPPKVGDQVELKVAGGRWDAGTRGTVVDVFSAGVIVEVADDDGKTERLDLPFEAVGPTAGA